MEKKYDSFIDLVPGYESVVDYSADSNADFWGRYIVTDDMVNAIKAISKSLKPDDPKNDVWHFWLKGSYGTGKTYSAIVLKHLLEDDYSVVESFLNKNKKFIDVKDKFLGARKKGKYYVNFRSGECLQLNTSNKFLFQIEKSIREVLKNNGFCYTGRNSLIESVRQKARTFRSALSEQFEAGAFSEYWGAYDSYNDFAQLVENGDVDACSQAQEIMENMDIGLATDLNTFKKWVTDVFDGNPDLAKTGIFIIWDEFTEYIRHNDLDIIQQLSIFSKEQPLFIIYVMHEYPGLFSEDVSANMGKADARFHKIDVSISDDTTRRLISESMFVKDGMKTTWADICNDLYDNISTNVHIFMSDPGENIDASELKRIFPIHPMTVELVTKVAGLAASGRSIFMFLKSNDDDGFRTYIHNNGYYDWKWVTADYLWDYYFVNNLGGKKTLTKMAEDCLKHYNKVSEKISDPKALRVFKAAMLLLATIGSGQSMKKGKGFKGIQATEKTLYNCFCGAMERDVLSAYLKSLSSDPLNVLVMAPDLHDGFRIELPYTEVGGELDAEISSLKSNASIGKLFDADKPFGSAIKKQFAPEDKPVVKRLVLDTCWGSTTQISNKFSSLLTNISKTNHKFGLLIVAASSSDEIAKAEVTAEALLSKADTKRMLICIMKYHLDEQKINQWYEFMANASLAQKANKKVNANSYTAQAEEIINTWVSTALGKDMALFFNGKKAVVYTNKGILSQYEKYVFSIFPNAPEVFIKTATLYKSVSVAPAYFAVSRTTLENKSPANDKQKSFNQQWQNVVDILKENDENIWDCNNIDNIISMADSKAGCCMSALCKLLNSQLTTGTVFLTDLWEMLQKELGYYDSSVCCYLLGFAFKFYIGKYTWHDGNNAYKLDEDTIPTMIVSMCSGKGTGMKLSSESDVEKRFKSLTQRVFSLSDEEIGDVYECRKYLKVHITKNGFPIWTVKYYDDLDFAGVKAQVCQILDRYVEFVLEMGSQTDVMEDIVNIFKQNAKGYVALLKSLLSDKSKMSAGMSRFIFSKSIEAKKTCEDYGFDAEMLITMLKNSLEEEVWQWREEKVPETIQKLTRDLKLVGIINKAIDGTSETIEKIKDTLSNYLSYVKVPGCVYKELAEKWAPSIQILYDISINKWIGYSLEEKDKILCSLEQYCSDAIDNINNPLSVLKLYIAKKGLGSFSDDEYDSILAALPNETFTQTESNFKKAIQNKIEDLGYMKKVRSLQTIWKNATGFDSLDAWTSTYSTPASWVFPELSNAFSVLRAIEKNERIDSTRIENAIFDFKNTDLTVMTDSIVIDTKFITNIASEKYVSLLFARANELREQIKESYKSVNAWPSKIVEIRKLIDAIILKEVRKKAKQRVTDMKEPKLREFVDYLLENSSEACLLFIEKE